MPRPDKDEPKEAYVARFMASTEARADYPEDKQRLAVAYSLWEHRNVLQNQADTWPRKMSGRHLEAGLVRYADMGPLDPATNKPTGLTLLLPKDTIDKMRGSLAGKPLINEIHKSVDPTYFQDGRADGIVTGGHFNGEDGWEWADFLVWDEDTKINCMNGYQLSCAYRPTEIDDTPGLWHNIPYDGIIKGGEYTHIAVVPNPRYEGAVIMCNSKGGSPMNNLLKMFFKKAGVDNSVELAHTTTVDVDDNKTTLQDLVNAYKADEAKKAAEALANSTAENVSDDAEIDVDGKKVSMKNLKNSYRDMLTRKNAEDDEKKKKDEEAKNAEEKEKKDKEDAERKNAEEKAAKEKKDKEDAEAKNAADKLAGATHFENLRAKTRQATPGQTAALMNEADREKLGTARYGSKGAAK